MILALRTDSFNTELYLVDQDGNNVASELWEAGRELSVQLLSKIDGLLQNHNASLHDIDGIVVYQGPGSFTGLRIGVAVANALGYGLSVPVIASQGDAWREDGLKLLNSVESFMPVAPFYGGDPHITQPKK